MTKRTTVLCETQDQSKTEVDALHVLVVDDIPLMRTMLCKFLKSMERKTGPSALTCRRVETVEAGNGVAALEVLQHRPVDVIFLDLMMPEMDGLTFLDRKRQDGNIQEIPVIVCSAVGESEVRAKATELGAVAFIVKPFTMRSVEEKFVEVLSRRTE